MAAIEEWGAMSQTFITELVGDQRANPKNFKDITEALMSASMQPTDGDPVFFLSMMLATAVIELAGQVES